MLSYVERIPELFRPSGKMLRRAVALTRDGENVPNGLAEPETALFVCLSDASDDVVW
jgi:hypothetical protein